MSKLRLILLLFAILFLVGGAVLTATALDIAESDGVDLFAPEGGIFQLELSESDITKLKLSVRNTEIRLCGNEVDSYIEFLNLPPNAYSLKITESTLSFLEKDRRSPLSDFGGGSSFRGLSSLFGVGGPEGRRSICIYLSPHDRTIQQIEINGTRCFVTADSFVNLCGISVYGEKSASFTADALLSQSALFLQAPRISLNLRDSALSALTVTGDKGTVTAQGLSFSRLDLAYRTGHAKIEAFGSPEKFALHLNEGDGTVELEERVLSRPLEYRPESENGSIHFTSEKGSLTLWFTGDKLS